MAHYKVMSVLILVGLVVLFAVQNYEVVELRFLFWTMAMSRALFFFLVFGIGIALGWLLRTWHSLGARGGPEPKQRVS